MKKFLISAGIIFISGFYILPAAAKQPVLQTSVVTLTANNIWKISGIVTDAETGEPLINANVLELSTNNGVITDIDGKYTITMQTCYNVCLKYSYTGYETQCQYAEKGPTSLGTSTTILNVALKPESQTLE